MCVAVPGRVVSIGEASTALIPAKVAFPDRTTEVNLVMLPEAAVGDHVVVHSGYAVRLTTPPIEHRTPTEPEAQRR